MGTATQVAPLGHVQLSLDFQSRIWSIDTKVLEMECVSSPFGWKD